MVPLWEDLEPYLFERDALGESFNTAALAEDWGTTTHEAARYIQSQLRAQTHPNSRVQFVLHRTGRTTNTIWHVGHRSADSREVGIQTVDDFQARVRRFVSPTLQRIGNLNPRALATAEAIVEGIEAGIHMMAAMMGAPEENGHA